MIIKIINHYIIMAMQNSLERISELLNSAEPDVLERIASTKRVTRERAIRALTLSLDEESEMDIAIFQTIPLEFIKRGDIPEAVWYIETVWKTGGIISWEVITAVYTQAIQERDTYLLEKDEEAVKAISSSLDALFRMAKTHPVYKNMPELYLLMGNHEEVKEKPLNALPFYDRAMEFWLIEWYLASANIYEQMKQYEGSEIVLDSGWIIHGDTRLLRKLIYTLCRAWKIQTAMDKYQELRYQSKEEEVPFLVYKWSIENDEELDLFEDMIAHYIAEGTFIPLESLHTLVSSANQYIKESRYEENATIQTINNKPLEEWTVIDREDFIWAVQRRLWLMQIDVFTLCNPRYLEYYISDLRKFWIEGTPESRQSLQDFFTEHFSKEVDYKVRAQYTQNQSDISNIGWEEAGDYISQGLFENIAMHASRLGELFFQWTFYNIQNNDINSVLRDCAKIDGTYHDGMEKELTWAISNLKKQCDYYDSLRPDVRENYENFLGQFDKKYGVFYRRHLQCLAIDPHITPEKYPEAIKEYHDVSFLFWIEKILNGQIFTDDPEELEKIVLEYSLHKVNIYNALLFWSLIYTISPDYAISFLADYPHMLDVPQALYLITDGLRSMDADIRKDALKDLHARSREDYGARGFFEHIKYTFGDIFKVEPLKEDLQYILLTNGNVAILQRKERIESITNFRAAGEYGSLEWLIQAGESYKNTGEYTKALELFEQAFCQNNTLSILEKILDCMIEAGQFEKAQKYIEHAIRSGYAIENHMLAFHLWQWNTELALLQMVSIIQNGIDIIDTPPWSTQLLFDTLSSILNTESEIPWSHVNLKILASFILSNIFHGGALQNPKRFLLHWQYINLLCNEYTWSMLDERIKRSIEPFVWNMDVDISNLSTSDISVELLQKHAKNTYWTLQKMFRNAAKNNDIEREGELFTAMNDLSAIISSILQRFPNTDRYISKWIDTIHFDRPPDYTMNDMPETMQ